MKHALTEYRERHGLTLQEFGSRIGVGKAAVWKWEAGSLPRKEMLVRIVEATGGEVTLADFIAVSAA